MLHATKKPSNPDFVDLTILTCLGSAGYLVRSDHLLANMPIKFQETAQKQILKLISTGKMRGVEDQSGQVFALEITKQGIQKRNCLRRRLNGGG